MSHIDELQDVLDEVEVRAAEEELTVEEAIQLIRTALFELDI